MTDLKDNFLTTEEEDKTVLVLKLSLKWMMGEEMMGEGVEESFSSPLSENE